MRLANTLGFSIVIANKMGLDQFVPIFKKRFWLKLIYVQTGHLMKSKNFEPKINCLLIKFC